MVGEGDFPHLTGHPEDKVNGHCHTPGRVNSV